MLQCYNVEMLEIRYQNVGVKNRLDLRAVARISQTEGASLLRVCRTRRTGRSARATRSSLI